jgi:hypothetical protein
MPRPRQRICLEDGLKLDLTKLTHQGCVRPGAEFGPCPIRWTDDYFGEEIARGLISGNVHGGHTGWFRIQIGNLDQRIGLITKPCHFGGRRWYFECPATLRCCSVLWLIPGRNRFCSREAWGRQVAYATQFASPEYRAQLGQAKIKSRLIDNLDPDEWDFPLKPKWMRWHSYERYLQRFEAYEEVRDHAFLRSVNRLTRS